MKHQNSLKVNNRIQNLDFIYGGVHSQLIDIIRGRLIFSNFTISYLHVSECFFNQYFNYEYHSKVASSFIIQK